MMHWYATRQTTMSLRSSGHETATDRDPGALLDDNELRLVWRAAESYRGAFARSFVCAC